jgi:uncharacterized protein with HEPN domain
MFRDEAFLLDILIASHRALQHLHNLSWDEFQDSALHQDAVIRQLEIIGEAARLVSDTYQEGHPEIPWQKMIGIWNRLLHEYFRVNVLVVWDTVHNDLPELINSIEPLLPPEDQV